MPVQPQPTQTLEPFQISPQFLWETPKAFSNLFNTVSAERKQTCLTVQNWFSKKPINIKELT